MSVIRRVALVGVVVIALLLTTAPASYGWGKSCRTPRVQSSSLQAFFSKSVKSSFRVCGYFGSGPRYLTYVATAPWIEPRFPYPLEDVDIVRGPWFSYVNGARSHVVHRVTVRQTLVKLPLGQLFTYDLVADATRGTRVCVAGRTTGTACGVWNRW